MTDPWSIDYFNPQPPKAAPAIQKNPRLLPDVDRLFAVQRNLLKALNDVQDMKPSPEVHRLEHNLGNAYKSIRGYLATYANPEGA